MGQERCFVTCFLLFRLKAAFVFQIESLCREANRSKAIDPFTDEFRRKNQQNDMLHFTSLRFKIR